MSRTIPASTDTALDDRFVVPIMFVELDFDTDPVYLHTDLGEITVLSKTWLGTGGLGTISPLEESIESRSIGFKLRLQITDESSGSIFQELTQQDFYQRECILYWALRDTSSGALVDDPFEFRRGKIDVPELTAGHGAAFVDLLIEDEFSDGQRALNRNYSDAQMQSEYSGDTFFRFAAEMANKRVGFATSISARLGTGGASSGGRDFSGDVR